MKKIIKYLTPALCLFVLASCSSNSNANNKSNKEEIDYSDDANYQVTDEEFRNMYNISGDYSVVYKLSSDNESSVSIPYETLTFKKDDNKMNLEFEYIISSSNKSYYSIINEDSSISTVEYNGTSYSYLNYGADVSQMIPKATSYISMDYLVDNKTFDSKSNMYKITEYPYSDSINIDMNFKFENKKIVYYSMNMKTKSATGSLVKVDFIYKDQTVTIPEDALQLLNGNVLR